MEVGVKYRSLGGCNLILLLIYSYLRILCSIKSSKLYKLREVRILGVRFRAIPILGAIYILGFPCPYLVEWIFPCPIEWIFDSRIFGMYVVTITVCTSIHNTPLWTFVIPITSFILLSLLLNLLTFVLSYFLFMLPCFLLLGSIWGITPMMRSLNLLKVYP